MDSQGRIRELVRLFTKEPGWLPSVSRDITDVIHAELADIDADPDFRDSTYASTDSVLRLLVDLALSRRSPREAEPPPAAVDYAWEFARRGLPLDSLLRAYHVGQATFFRRWSEKARADIDDPDRLAEAIELGADWTFEYIEALSGGLVRRYGEERERWVRSAAAVRAQVVEAVLAGETIDVAQASSRLGYELEQNHQAVVLWSEDSRDRLDAALAMLERAALQLLGQLEASASLLVPRARMCLVAWVGWHGAGELAAIDSAHVDVRAFPGVLAAWGSRGSGVAGFARSQREALNARRIAQLTQQRAGSVTRYEKVALAALASVDVDEAREFVAAELGGLIGRDDQSVRLSATLRVYLEENLSPSRAARRLGVHEHTISNRIRSAQQQLPHPIEQRVCELQVALRLIRLAQGSLEASP